jgi:hypothetical protein
VNSLLGPRGASLNGISPRDARDEARRKLQSLRDQQSQGLSLKRLNDPQVIYNIKRQS